MKKILIVDDQDDIRRMIKLTLGGQYLVFEAADAREAQVIINRELPDAVVLDVMMPGDMDGYELCRRIKQNPRLANSLVILVTARGQAADKAAGMAVGADAYFVKPFSPLQLVGEIRKHL
jgi:two-component system phosphate regulon response regulator PhoB